MGAFGKSEPNWCEPNQITYIYRRVFQKYVYSSFIVKMRINLRSFGLLWLTLGRGQAPGRISGTLNFGVLWVKKVKYRSAENIGY